MFENNEYIGTLTYDYGREVPELEGIVTVWVTVSAKGTVELACEEIGKDRQSVILELK